MQHRIAQMHDCLHPCVQQGLFCSLVSCAKATSRPLWRVDSTKANLKRATHGVINKAWLALYIAKTYVIMKNICTNICEQLCNYIILHIYTNAKFWNYLHAVLCALLILAAFRDSAAMCWVM